MTEARTIQDETSASRTEQVAQGRPAVERWLRWSGLVPLCAFLLLHVGGELVRAFPADLRDVLRAPSTLLGTSLSVLLVWLPLTVHLGLGGWGLATPRQPPPINDSEARLPRMLSRLCALLATGFVLYHAQRYPLAVWLRQADARDAGFRLIDELSTTRFGVPLSGAGYLLGLLATCTHAGIGAHRALLAEGYLRDERRRRISARACATFGVLCFVVGAAAVIRVASGVLLR